jgi:hypothetical protein
MIATTPLRWCYAKSQTHVYYNQRIVEGADPQTFEVLHHLWARDHSRVYLYYHPVAQADAGSFVMLNELFAKDANNIWTLPGIVRDADVATFEVLDQGAGNVGYARDKHNVYFLAQYLGKANIVRNADPATFRSIGNGFGVDQERVFYGRTHLPKARPETWHPLQSFYSCDARRVFYQNAHLKDADARTFEVLPGEDIWARDRRHYFTCRDVREENDYWREFAGFYIFVGVVTDTCVIDRNLQRVGGETRADLNAEQRQRIEIECREWIFQPLEIAPNQPRVGDRMYAYKATDHLTHGIGDTWIWFFTKGPWAHADREIIRPILKYDIFEPIENRPKVEALVRQFKQRGLS